MDNADVGVVDGGGSLGFLNEALAFIIANVEAVRQELQSHETIEFGIFGFVDHSHAAFAELFDDFVLGNRFANHCTVLNICGFSS